MSDARPKWVGVCRGAGIALITITATLVTFIVALNGSFAPFGGDIHHDDVYFVVTNPVDVFIPAVIGAALIVATFLRRGARRRG